jgi:hypothetical protein
VHWPDKDEINSYRACSIPDAPLHFSRAAVPQGPGPVLSARASSSSRGSADAGVVGMVTDPTATEEKSRGWVRKGQRAKSSPSLSILYFIFLIKYAIELIFRFTASDLLQSLLFLVERY